VAAGGAGGHFFKAGAAYVQVDLRSGRLTVRPNRALRRGRRYGPGTGHVNLDEFSVRAVVEPAYDPQTGVGAILD